MKVSLLPTVIGDSIDQGTATWEQLTHYCQNAPMHPDKQSCPLIKLASFGDRRTAKGSLRHDANILTISGVEGDYDDGVISASDATMMLQFAGIKSIIYTSPSHTPEKPRWRVLAPLSREHEPRDRRELIAKVNGALGGILADESFTLSQTYYIGRVEGATYEVHLSDGQPVDLAHNLLPIYPVRSVATAMPAEYDERTITQEVIEELRSALQMLSSDDRSEWIAIGQALAGLGDVGFELWADWSASSNKHNPDQDLKRWNTFSGERTGFQSVFAKAQRAGWINPKKQQPVNIDGVFQGAVAPGNTSAPVVVGEFMPLHFKLDEMAWPDMSRTRNKPQATGRNLEHLLTSYGIKCYYDEILKESFMVFPGQVDHSNDMSENGKYQELKSLLAMNEVPSETADRIPSILMKHTCNPVLEFITGEPWDGVSRLDDLFNTVTVDHADVAYRNAAMRMWLVQCAAAADGGKQSPIYNKVSKFEAVLIFQGGQGLKKTTWISSLLPPAYREYILDGVTLDLNDKDSRKHAVSGWIVELGELDGTFRKSDIAKLKGFLSLQSDSMRMPYDKLTSKFQRQTSFFASVNESRFLVDDTGNRRFIPVQVLSANPNHRLNMQQIWAEVWGLYLAGEQWWPDESLTQMLAVRHEKHQQVDHIEDSIRGKFNLEVLPDDGKIWSCTEILKECGWNTPTKADTNAVGRVLRNLGFVEYKTNKVRGYKVIARNLMAEKVFSGQYGG